MADEIDKPFSDPTAPSMASAPGAEVPARAGETGQGPAPSASPEAMAVIDSELAHQFDGLLAGDVEDIDQVLADACREAEQLAAATTRVASSSATPAPASAASAAPASLATASPAPTTLDVETSLQGSAPSSSRSQAEELIAAQSDEEIAAAEMLQPHVVEPLAAHRDEAERAGGSADSQIAADEVAPGYAPAPAMHADGHAAQSISSTAAAPASDAGAVAPPAAAATPPVREKVVLAIDPNAIPAGTGEEAKQAPSPPKSRGRSLRARGALGRVGKVRGRLSVRKSVKLTVRPLVTPLSMLNYPLRFAPESARPMINVLALTMAMWVPIVWLAGPMMFGSHDAAHGDAPADVEAADHASDSHDAEEHAPAGGH